MAEQCNVAFFLGANTPNGFVSLYDSMASYEDGWHLYVIKGGPGTGKSTTMRHLADALEGSQPVEYIHCSSDADSLDAILLPQTKLAVLDGTPPHPMEPKYPGAYETCFYLNDCWDEALLVKRGDRIVSLFQEIEGHHRQARRFLNAAGALLTDRSRVAARETDYHKIAGYARRMAAKEFSPTGNPHPRETLRFLSAVTDQGPVCFSETLEALCDRVIALEDPYGASAQLLMSLLRAHALERGQDVISCYCPMAPHEKLEHLILPQLRLGFVTVNPFHPMAELSTWRTIHASRFTDTKALSAHKHMLSFHKRAAAQMLQQAGEHIAQAKALHNLLEEEYMAAMDYQKVNAKRNVFAKEFRQEAQRRLDLLSR